ncbi:MAG: hypothetical protein AAF725_10050 [Acidobacteriota bacterium]
MGGNFMDLLVTVSLFVLATSVLVIGIVLKDIAAEIRRTRRAVERISPSPAHAPAAENIESTTLVA